MSPVLVVAGVVLLVVLGWLVLLYNRFVALDNAAERAWANVDVILRQRSDEVRNLEAVVKGYASHERALLEHVAHARATLAGDAGVRAKAEADAQLRMDLPRLIAVAESYPDLKANEGFLALQKRITSLEDILADRREFYNHSVVIFNTRIREIPDTWMAQAMRLRAKAYFTA